MRKRPTASIMGDDWFGHRDPITGSEMGDREEYTNWDWTLLNVFQIIEDSTDEKSGLVAWELEDENAYVDANRKVNRFQAAIDKKTKGTPNKPYKPTPGEYFTPNLKSHKQDENGDPVFQTRREWIEKQVAKEQD